MPGTSWRSGRRGGEGRHYSTPARRSTGCPGYRERSTTCTASAMKGQEDERDDPGDITPSSSASFLEDMCAGVVVVVVAPSSRRWSAPMPPGVVVVLGPVPCATDGPPRGAPGPASPGLASLAGEGLGVPEVAHGRLEPGNDRHVCVEPEHLVRRDVIPRPDNIAPRPGRVEEARRTLGLQNPVQHSVSGRRFDLVCSSARTMHPHGAASYVSMSKRLLES